MNPVRKEFQFGDHRVVLETNKIARQATGAVMASMGDTMVLCTVVANPNPNPAQSFLPLTVNYQEKFYATGKIPGGFLRREGRPSDKETLTSRLIDRPIRPLFPDGFRNAVQVIATVMSVDRDMDPDVIALLGSSAALAVSGIPFKGPIGAARVGYADGRYLLNPGYEALSKSALNMVVAGTESAVLMVESEAKELSEDQMLGGVLYGHIEMQTRHCRHQGTRRGSRQAGLGVRGGANRPSARRKNRLILDGRRQRRLSHHGQAAASEHGARPARPSQRGTRWRRRRFRRRRCNGSVQQAREARCSGRTS